MSCKETTKNHSQELSETSEGTRITNHKEWGKKNDKKLHFPVAPGIAFTILAIPDSTKNDSAAILDDYMLKLNHSLPKEYDEESGMYVVEKVYVIANNIFVKVKVSEETAKELEEPVNLALSKLIFMDYLKEATERHKEFKEGLEVLNNNHLDICYHLISKDKSQDIIIRNRELRDSILRK